MTYREYQDFRYFVTKEDHYYNQVLRPSKEVKEKAEYYRHLKTILEAFEIDAIKDAFIRECEEDFQ